MKVLIAEDDTNIRNGLASREGLTQASESSSETGLSLAAMSA